LKRKLKSCAARNLGRNQPKEPATPLPQKDQTNLGLDLTGDGSSGSQIAGESGRQEPVGRFSFLDCLLGPGRRTRNEATKSKLCVNAAGGRGEEVEVPRRVVTIAHVVIARVGSPAL
jgi:hypothetical protein